MKVLHVIVGLNIGGAELMLARLAGAGCSRKSVVVSLTTTGIVGTRLSRDGVSVYSLAMSGLLSLPSAVYRLYRIIKKERPDVVQTWMYHADLIGGVVSRICGQKTIIWGVRCTCIPQHTFSRTAWLVRACSLMSHFVPSGIVCCSKSGYDAHVKNGYAKNKMVVIPNGYDFDDFTVDISSAKSMREKFRFGEDDIVVAAVGRFDRLKDYWTFIRAASGACRIFSNVRILMIGRGVDWSNLALKEWITAAGFKDRFVLAGERFDIPQCLAGIDIFCLSSLREGFPNVVVEAMAAAKPCVVTAAGDAALIVGNCGEVVSPGDAEKLTRALCKTISLSPMERAEVGERGRARVQSMYSIECIRKQYYQYYSDKIATNE